MELKKITEADLQGVGVVGMEDTPNLSALEMQKKVEEVVREVVIPAINANVDATASKEDLRMAVLNAGAGDMHTNSYDKNMDGVVERADNGMFTFVHTKTGTVHSLTGNYLPDGIVNIRFAAKADWNSGDTLEINGVEARCYNYAYERIEGEELFKLYTRVEFVAELKANGSYECFFKTGGAGLNFKVVSGTTAPASPKENMLWVNTATAVSSWEFASQQPDLRSKNKNIVVLDATTKTVSGITFTVNNNGSITVNGTSTAGAEFRVCTKAVTDLLEVGQKYTFSATGNSNIGFGIHERTAGNVWVKTHSQVYGGGQTFTYNGVSAPGNEMYLYLYIATGKTVTNVTLYPQLEKGSTATSFVKGDATGQLWIKSGTNGNVEFNALKKNGIYIFPQSCMQWNGSTWVSKDVKVYKGGQWLALKFWFLQGSNQCTDETGGWSIIKSENGSYQAATIGSSGMTFTGTANISRSMATAKAIDFAGIETLYISVPTISNASGEAKCMSFGIDETRDFTWTSNAKQGWTVEKFISYPQNGSGIVYALDTSNVNSKCYILMAVTCGNGNTVTVVVDEIYGE